MTRPVRSRLMVVWAFCCAMMSTTLVPATAQGEQSRRFIQPFVLAQAPTNSTAESDTLPASVDTTLSEPMLESGQESILSATRLQFGAHTFTSTSMNAAYDPVSIAALEYVAWSKRFGFGFELGWSSGNGVPPLTNSNWAVNDSWVEISALSIGIDLLYRFMNTSNDGFLEPYVTLGPAIWIGGERISAQATRMPVGVHEGFRAELLGAGVTVGANAGVGTTVRLFGRLRGLFEVGWTLTTAGGTADVISDEEKEDFDSTLYSAVARPGFDFTGWQFNIGVQW